MVSTLLLLLSRHWQSLCKDGLGNPEDNDGENDVEYYGKHDRDDPSCFSCLGRVWVRMGLGTLRRSTP